MVCVAVGERWDSEREGFEMTVRIGLVFWAGMSVLKDCCSGLVRDVLQGSTAVTVSYPLYNRYGSRGLSKFTMHILSSSLY